MEIFPAYPTLLYIGGYQERPNSGVRRTEMEDRMVKQLKTVSRVLKKRRVVYRLKDAADMNAFEAFVNVNLNLGADWFSWTDPRDLVLKNARIENGTVEYDAQRKVLDRWFASFTIETYA